MNPIKLLADTAIAGLLSLSADTSLPQTPRTPSPHVPFVSADTSPVQRSRRLWGETTYVMRCEQGQFECPFARSFVVDVGNGATCADVANTPMHFVVMMQETTDLDELSRSERVIQDFERDYLGEPEEAISRLLKQLRRSQSTVAGGITPDQAVTALLAHLPKAAYGRQNLLINAIRCNFSAIDVLNGALANRESTAASDVLEATAGLLEHYGADAWPALQRLATSQRSECRYFVRQIAHCEGIPEAERTQALIELAGNPDLSTCLELVDALDTGSLVEPAIVLRKLTTSADREIQQIAMDRLEACD